MAARSRSARPPRCSTRRRSSRPTARRSSRCPTASPAVSSHPTTTAEPMIHWLTDPWSQEVLRRAFAEVVLLGAAGGALGCWVVLYGLSYGAESLAHGLFPGLVVAALIGAPLLLGGAVGIAVAAVAVAGIARLPGLDRDVGVAVVVTTLFGLGVLLALSPATPRAIQGLLFGDILGLTDGDLALAAGLAALTGLVLWLGARGPLGG